MDENSRLISHESNFLPFGHGKCLERDLAKGFINFVNFVAGRRRCIGENLAKSNLFVFFATFMHSFDMKSAIVPPMEGVDGITIAPKPLRVRITSK